jgi:hypothetical protein
MTSDPQGPVITGPPDRSPRAANRAPATGPAEISSYQIVSEYFGEAAERLGLEEDVRAVMS